jgi:hypothetical protein
MEYAKIKDGFVVKYPYTQKDLETENPYTNFGDTTNLTEKYIGTTASEDGSFVIEVNQDRPDFDLSTEQAIASALPVYANGVCAFEWTVSALPLRNDPNGDGT